MKLAIFDMDGTLFNTNNINYYAYKEALDKYKGNKPYAKPLLRKNYAMGLGDVPQPMWLRHAYIYIKEWGQGANGDSKP